MEISVNNLTSVLVDEVFLKGISKEVLNQEKKQGSLSIVLVGKRRIKRLNRQYLGKNRVTDVLSFPLEEIGIGEIVICLKEVKKNAKRNNTDFKEELVRTLIHGILHLINYKNNKELKEKEEKYLKNFFEKK